MDEFQPLLSNGRVQRKSAFLRSLPRGKVRLNLFLYKQTKPINLNWLLHCSNITLLSVVKRGSSKIYYVTSWVVYDTNIVFCTLHLQLNYWASDNTGHILFLSANPLEGFLFFFLVAAVKLGLSHFRCEEWIYFTMIKNHFVIRFE